MKRKFINIRFSESYDNEKGALETIEQKIERITENNEPITDGVQMIFTKRGDGVLPQFNVRADKWALSQEAMGKVAAAKKGTIAKKLRGAEEPKAEEPKAEEPKAEESKAEE